MSLVTGFYGVCDILVQAKTQLSHRYTTCTPTEVKIRACTFGFPVCLNVREVKGKDEALHTSHLSVKSFNMHVIDVFLVLCAAICEKNIFVP